MEPMKRVRVRSLVLGLLFVAAGCKANAGNGARDAAEAPVKVETVKVGEQAMPRFVVLTGTVAAAQESEVAANAAGQVTATHVERGQTVKKGQLLATLDARAAALGAEAATAQSELARSQAELARSECERGKKLLEAQVITQTEYDRRMANCSVTGSSVAAASANREAASKMVRDAQIRAPFAGVIGDRWVNVGQYVRPDSRVASLYQMDPLRLELTVPEAAIGSIKEGMAVDFQVAAHGEERFTGTVKFVSPAVRKQSRDLLVEATVPNGDGRLRPGMFAVARLLAGEPKTAVIPVGAVKREGTTARVFAVVEGIIEERLVQAGEERGGVVAVGGGLKPGETVVVNPGERVRDGARVQ
jgi:membrane fusion protein, multidrug efflux system